MKIGIFYMEQMPTLFQLTKAAKKAGAEPHLFHLRDLRFSISEKCIDLKVGKISLKDFSVIFVRGFWNYEHEVSLLANFCKANGITLIDSALFENQIISKNNDLFILKNNGFNVIKTVFHENQKYADSIIQEVGLPMVAKEVRGKRGFEVYLLHNKKQLLEFLREKIPNSKTYDTQTYQFQKFIPADFDIRVLVLGGEVLGAIERRSADPTDFRHNITLGGTATKIEISLEIKRLAIKAARALKYEFAGVDFIIDKYTGETFILEVNRSPGFKGFVKATGIDVPLELMRFFLRFRKNALK